ncbi:MAG: ATP-dependent helicase, partial [Candidatus Aminicenantes bacterium]|nr:ATP-dependent helicase [Candidatus Aminicenantes bacterium]
GEIPFLKQEPVKMVVDVYRAIYDTDNIYLKSRLHKHKILDESDQRNLIMEIQGKNLTDKLQLIMRNYFPTEVKENELVFKLLMDIAEEFKNNEEAFFRQIMIGSGIDTWKQKIEAVNLMTMHASKGLEFNCVFISGCEEKLIPFSLFENNPSDPEEERRLLYVAMTRAKSYLFLTYARQRFLMGNEQYQERSHFLDLIEKELLITEPSQFRQKQKKDQDQLKLF